MDAYEKFALDHFLSFYPKEKTFVEVLDLLMDENDRTV